MAITVTPNLTLVSNCDQITGWAGGISNFSLDTNVPVQGTGCLAAWIDNQLSAIQYYALPTAVNMSGDGHHIYIRMLVSNGQVDTKALGGYRVVVYSGLTNYVTFYVGGNDTVESGWQLFVVDPTATPNATVGTFNPAAVTHIGVQFKTITAGRKQGQIFIYNVFWDIVRYGTGLIITSLATDEITLEDIYQVDFNTANKYGVLQKQAGAYILNGKLTFGGDFIESINFIMNGEVLLCPNSLEVGENFNAIEVLGNTTGTSNFEVSGSFIKANLRKITLNLDNANLNTIEFIGSSLINGDPIFREGQTIENNVFALCGQIIPNTSVFKGNTINKTNSIIAALLYPIITTNISDNNYLDNTLGSGVELNTDQVYTFVGEYFLGNTTDINNTSGNNIEVNATEGSNPATFKPAGTVQINNAVTLKLTGLIPNTEVTILEHGTQDIIAHVENSLTEFDFTYSYPLGHTIDIHIHNVDYIWIGIFNLIVPSSSSSIPIQQQEDWVGQQAN